MKQKSDIYTKGNNMEFYQLMMNLPETPQILALLPSWEACEIVASLIGQHYELPAEALSCVSTEGIPNA